MNYVYATGIYILINAALYASNYMEGVSGIDLPHHFAGQYQGYTDTADLGGKGIVSTIHRGGGGLVGLSRTGTGGGSRM